MARITPSIGPYVPAPGLRFDDLVFILVGAVPGAIVGGRLGYVLDHLGYYKANPAAILDPAQGGLTLTLAVPLGILTGGFIARLLGAPVGRWLHAAAFPLLFVLAAGKLIGVLGATGQGAPSDLPWATAYAGPGPWGSLARRDRRRTRAGLRGDPGRPRRSPGWPSLARVEVIARRDGAAMFAAIGLWAIARFVVAFTWRDPAALGPLRMEQLLDLGAPRRRRPRPAGARAGAAGGAGRAARRRRGSPRLRAGPGRGKDGALAHRQKRCSLGRRRAGPPPVEFGWERTGTAGPI